MPIEIKELQISINVTDDDISSTGNINTNEILKECIEQISIIEKDRNER